MTQQNKSLFRGFGIATFGALLSIIIMFVTFGFQTGIEKQKIETIIQKEAENKIEINKKLDSDIFYEYKKEESAKENRLFETLMRLEDKIDKLK